jgi:RsiW-degrading membrane proteinase PrsW (M82 family)
MSFAVYMGYYYGLAKTASVRGNQSLSRMNLFAAVLIAVLLHAIYDGALMIGSEMSMLFFLVFVIFLDIFVIIRIKNEAKHDEPIW